jgi:prevent-host-death family protein
MRVRSKAQTSLNSGRFTKTLSASEFKKHCPAVLREVQATRVPVVLTKRGKPVARLEPAARAPRFIGRLKGVFKAADDLNSPKPTAAEQINLRNGRPRRRS